MADSLLNDDSNDQFDPNKDYLSILTGPGGKYDKAKYGGDEAAALKAMARGKAEADTLIDVMKVRNDEMRNDYLALREQHQASAQLKDLIDQFEKSRGNASEFTPKDDNSQPAIKPEDIDRIVEDRLTKHQKTLKENENFNAIQGKLKEQLGEDYQAIYKQRLDNLGLTREFADDLARQHPTAFIRTFGLDSKPERQDFQAPARSSVRPNSFGPNVQKKDYAYYQELKKANPRIYLDPKISLEMHDSLMEMGPEEFWGNNKP